ncbi:MAG: ribosome maturation factor RimP [Rickettsiaceae bacterium]|jgi:ribosome maturation factor RimP|nr:ribosome maturation factor RimP [Rickettsiaceae bacterium]
MKAELTLEGRINEVISPSLEQLGYEVVRVRMIGEVRKVLQIMIDRADGANINVDDCQKASNQISAVLDVEEPILEKYTLEVSSPGIDRPLTRLKDFEKFKGLEAKMELSEKINEKRKLKGVLAGTEGDVVLMDLNVVSIEQPVSERIKVKFENIKSASLVLNDQLLAMSQK